MEDRIVVDVADRVVDASEVRRRPHLERAHAELEEERPWDVDREPPAPVDA